VPHGYVSGTSLSGSATYSGTIASVGATPGTYTWTWDKGANSFVLNVVKPTGVPEPSAFAGLLLGGGRNAPLVGNRERIVLETTYIQENLDGNGFIRAQKCIDRL
jgi:hypothetical protein